MKRKRTGQYYITAAGGEEVSAFVPDPLPPNPKIRIDNNILELLEKSSFMLGRLDSLRMNMPNAEIILYQYIRKEAVLSSQIEGTQSSLSDLLKYENNEVPGVPLDDVLEVSNYIAAMNYGLERIRKDDFPLSTRLLKEIHEILLSRGRGSQRNPGEFKRSQNWIGGTRPGNAVFVPTPPHKVSDCMGDLEKFIHDKTRYIPVLIKAALIHTQFETIHPFLDGNGRMGRLLIPLFLCTEGILHDPLLYLSLYLKTFREEYYDLLQSVRLSGDWEKWIAFFLEGIHITAYEAVETAHEIIKRYESDKELMTNLGKLSGSVFVVHQHLFKKQIVTPKNTANETGITFPTVQSALQRLEKAGIAKEVTGKKRNKVFIYEKSLEILNRGLGKT